LLRLLFGGEENRLDPVHPEHRGAYEDGGHTEYLLAGKRSIEV
jgi:hypothetical protein